MNRELDELSEMRWDHLADCDICTARAWVEGLELCDVGGDIRRRIKAALGEASPAPCAACGGSGYVIVAADEDHSFARTCSACRPARPVKAYRSPNGEAS